MNVLIKSATIIDTNSEFHNKTLDILVEQGSISNIGTSLENPNNYQEITLDNLHVSQGWFDSSVSFGEPGLEERETIANGLKTAAYSGFTTVALNANSNPVIDSNSDITFVSSRALGHAVNVLPIGALTKASNGIDLAELYDMKTAGAVAYYDYKKPISNANLMKIALQYASNFNGLVCSFPQDNGIAGKGVMNEHITSTTLGLKGIPALAEELQIARDLFLLEYTGGKLHIPTVSTAKSVALIRAAKLKQLDVSCSVAIHNLYFNDSVLQEFNTHYKVLPPLRINSDVEALLAGVKDGTIDMVTSDHNPLNIEEKKVEFDYAAYGTIGLESAFGALHNLFSLEQTIALLTQGKQRFGAESTTINVGNIANLTLFNPDSQYIFTTQDIISKSKNAIFEGEKLKGKTYGVCNNNQLVLNTK
ncbi:dihydroorotase [Formosa sediminum]|uniref:Dihydroorotase n=1 Tax=Formosa sediminum TaxID=2594004 RepID=A0A516GTF4_9FLAO|nr:dihydroorotase [Formosa sediminum]QDO94787.1 dihydroorotase [Formosa sediminum]